MIKNDIDVITTEYHFSHGAEPRGRGGWAFAFGTPDAEPEWCPESTTYSKARTWAVCQAAQRGIRRVYVLS